MFTVKKSLNKYGKIVNKQKIRHLIKYIIL